MTQTILTVDDSRTMRDMLRMALAEAGFNVLQAVDGVDGLEVLQRSMPDVIVTDINMPKMDGLGFLQNVRANPATKKAAFIILTAQGDRALVQKAAQMGANNVLAKPFTIEKMKAAIEAVFGPLK